MPSDLPGNVPTPVIGGLAAAILVPIIMNKLASTNAPARLEGEHKVVSYSKGYFASMYICTFFFSALSVLAYLNPGKTGPQAIVVPIMVFLFFAAMGLFTVVLMNKTRVYFNSEQVRGADMLGRRHVYRWNELKGVEYVAWAQGLKLSGPDGGSIWVSPVMSGFAEFQEELERQCGHLWQNTAQ
ncbi:MAG TPA: hypothetical protein PLC15_12505 [Candidatus Obscuribacter sp.]|nr:hypothetical protein [Candidatus Obscuribacter sp.]HNA74642.1 hypothetical protein [Candidatus Obscuribacter sp.]HNB16198.1 hypothetical protein [Candidatus Obscuribacter sp.]